MGQGRTDSKDLNVMMEAVKRACKALGIQPEEQDNRKRIAFLMARSTRTGIYDLEGLTSRVTAYFKTQI